MTIFQTYLWASLSLHSERLSTRFILVLHEAMKLLRQTEEAAIAVASCIDGLATMPDLTDMERLLAHTLLAYCLYQKLSPSTEAVLILHANIRSLPPKSLFYPRAA
jgi:hypothetical protein